jgi:hypothetical protein
MLVNMYPEKRFMWWKNKTICLPTDSNAESETLHVAGKSEHASVGTKHKH